MKKYVFGHFRISVTITTSQTALTSSNHVIDYDSSKLKLSKRKAEAVGGGVQIKFATPFADIPSVIATPAYTNEIGDDQCR